MEAEQLEMLLDDPRRPNPETVRFEAFHARHPHYFGLLVEAARRSVELHGRCTIHHARDEVMLRHRKGPERSFLPAYALKIEAECPDLRGKIATRRSRFGP